MIRVATFNLNNLFDRFNFHAALPRRATVTATYQWRLDRRLDVIPSQASTPGEGGTGTVEGSGPVKVEVASYGRLVTPKQEGHLKALLRRTDRLNADVLAVQEVENLTALREFNALLDAPYPYLALFEGNDTRLIDVGLLSGLPIRRAISHRWVPDEKRPSEFLFSRDLMAVEVMDGSRNENLFTVWIAHLKSKFVDPDITDVDEIRKAEEENNDRRLRQAQAARDIIAGHHDVRTDRFIVSGDLNDGRGSVSLKPLLDGKLGLEDVLGNEPTIDYESPEGMGPHVRVPEDMPRSDDWTHRHRVSDGPDIYARLDYLLVSKALSENRVSAGIQRRTHWGLDQAGSDHDPIFVDLDLCS